MTIDEALAGVLPEHKKCITDVIDVLEKLKEMDLEMIDHLRTMAELMKPLLPPEMQNTVKCLVADLTLVRIFSEQARKYDQYPSVEAIYDKIFGKEDKG